MRTKILFRIPNMDMGGVQKVMLDIIANLDKERFECFVLLDLLQGELLNNIPEDIKVYSLGKGKAYMSPFKIVGLCQLMVRNLKFKLYYWFPDRLKKHIDIIPDIEIAMMHLSLPLLLRSPFRNSRKINWFHSDIRFCSLRRGRKIASMMDRCDTSVFGSLSTKAIFQNHLGVYIQKSICIYNTFNELAVRKKSMVPIDKQVMTILKKGNVFVSVGRLVYQKGYDQLLEIHSELINEGLVHQIIIVGGGPDYEKLKNRAVELGVEDSFHLLGTQDNPYPYIAAGNYYIQPSRYEAYPLALGEAMILAKPIISTNVGGVKELLVHGHTGYLIDFDKEAIKLSMKKFMEDLLFVDSIRRNQTNFDFKEHNQKIYHQINELFSARKKEQTTGGSSNCWNQ